ncbi:salicylate hydroxylase [Coniochaeta ligniaria NRRL 30616]|uniref:Salicylate hydroxylase n=1 Tax=Coniochaeta ligniaria NRRL 30616 TaxID=1408157 RepID=A0A1J7J5D3_9PEZI|nr:salicylate hydroxylase [Coniochaeta ligniaria NRRL 30616]
MSPPTPRIAIIGAGPAGLTLAALLHKRAIPFTLFELRPRPTPSDLAAVSGMLDLHDESGLAAVRACDLYDDLLPLTADCEQAMRLLDVDGGVRHQDADEGEGRPEVSRHNLTGLLLSRIPAEMIRWDHKLRSATRRVDESSSVLLDFGEKGTHVFDFVVGADGAWSRVRQALIPDAAKPRYTGVQNLVVTARQIGTRYPQLAELVGRGSMFSLGMGHVCASHHGPQDSARLYVGVGTDEEDFVRVRGLEGKTAAEVGSVYLADENLYGRWGEKMKELIRTVCDEETKDHPGQAAELRGIYELPVGHAWQHRPGVTIIGDAAHLMTPWAGEGANISMWDSLDLAAVLVDAWEAAKARGSDTDGGLRRVWQEELDPKLAAFEKVMQERGAVYAEESSNNGKMIFSDDGLEKFVAFFKSHGPPPE